MEHQSPQMHLQTLLQDFHGITQISISYLPVQVADGMGDTLHYDKQSEPMNRFLAQLRRIPELRERMEQREADAISQALKHPEGIRSFEPFPGLTAYIFPVVSRNILLGCVSFGPVRQAESHYAHFQRSSLYHAHGLDQQTMSGLYDQLPTYDTPAMMAASRLLTQIVLYASSIDSVTSRTKPLSVRIVEYIDSQYMNAISPGTACDHFHISRSMLSRTISREFGDTFLSMLSQRRIRNVCRLLDEGLSPDEASTLSGFSSPLYMARVFRTIMSCTPHAYQKRKDPCPSAQQKEAEHDDHTRQ